MKCNLIRASLSSYLDGELTGAQANRLQRHLALCSGCRREWELLRRTVRLVGRMGRERCPVDLRASVAQAVSHSPREVVWGARPLRAALWSGLATSMAVIAAAWAVSHGFAPRGPDGLVTRPPAAAGVVAEARLHDQYNMAIGFGNAEDGLLLSLPTGGGSKSLPRNAAYDTPRVGSHAP